MNDVILFFISQSVIIIGAILLAYVRTQVAIARLQDGVQATRSHAKDLKADHIVLATKVDGMSIKLAKLQGHIVGPNGRGDSGS